MCNGGITSDCRFAFPITKRTAALLLALACAVHAQETPAPQPTSSTAKAIPISFVPPPMDGTISLGIYDAKGTLVRVLHREADVEEFEAGTDALKTSWDGKNDAGEMMPSGKYHARGYAVDADVEGVGYFFNDWVTDEKSLRITKITAIELENGVPLLSAKLVDGGTLSLLGDMNANVMNTGQERPRHDKCEGAAGLAQVVEPISCAPGKGSTRWVIDRVAHEGTEVKQFSGSGELLRRLSIPAEDPQPQQIAASQDADMILLLEENSARQRLRSLTLLATKSDSGQAISDWKVEWEKTIAVHKDFGVANGKPVASGGKAPGDRISAKLQANALQKDARSTLEIVVGYDADGSFLKTANGLPLQSISETPHLTRIVLAPHGENTIDVFQDDAAVVEQFRATDLNQMMAFDCGEIELK